LLIHESTFTSERAQDAREKGHATAAEAARVAVQAGARRLALTNISARYTDPAVLLADAQPIFANTVVAEDLMTLEV
jgi:ribonuclease Z